MSIQDSNISLCSILGNHDYFYAKPPNTGADVRDYFTSLGTNIYESAGNNADTIIFENDILRITANANKSAGRPYMISLSLIDKRNSYSFNISPTNLRNCYLALGYDDDEHKAYFFLSGQFYYSGAWNVNPASSVYCGLMGTSAEIQQEMYELISGSQIPTYNWVSVPSVTGKNGTISLAQIASDSINDGEPVSGAAATAFSSLPDSANVGEIIDDLLPYEESVADVLVKYKIKSSVAGAFSILKVVAKAGSIPKSIEDGDVVANLNPNKKSKLVSGLAEGTTYYFVIFAEDITGNTAQSEPKKIKTGETPYDPSPFKEMVEVLLQTGEDEYTSVYDWTGTWGQPDEVNVTHFTVEAQENLDITESATETHFVVEHNETNFISENTETEIVLT